VHLRLHFGAESSRRDERYCEVVSAAPWMTADVETGGSKDTDGCLRAGGRCVNFDWSDYLHGFLYD